MLEATIVDRATRRRLYNLCQPAEPLLPGDDRYVDLDSFGVRGTSLVDPIAQRIDLSDSPVTELAIGVPGAGMTTELRRLAARLAGDANILGVHVDAEQVLDLTSPIDTIDLLLVIVEETARVVRSAEGQSSAKKLFGRLWSFLTSTEASLAPDMSAVVLKSAPSLRERLRAHVNADRSRFLSLVREELTLLDHEARKRGQQGIVVMLDGLEKLRGTSSTMPEVLDSAERAFAAGSPLFSLPVHVVYTLPLAMLVRAPPAARILPMIALHRRDGWPRTDGFEAASELIMRRVPVPVLDELLGAEHRNERLSDLISASGGSPRELLRLLQVIIAEGPLDQARFTRTLAMESELSMHGIPEDGASWLARVHAQKSLDVTPLATSRTVEAMLVGGKVLPYRDRDGGVWFDVHPSALRAPALVAALERAAAQL